MQFPESPLLQTEIINIINFTYFLIKILFSGYFTADIH